MNIFNSPSQSRESLTIWRIFSMLPLNAGLAQGQIYSWYAVNIPMNLVPGTKYTSDIDIMGCFRVRMSDEKMYRTWEVKVGLISKEGKGKSLKGGKTKDILKQLTAYRNFGSPYVSLLDTYLCEDGLLENNPFPTAEIAPIIKDHFDYAKEHGFGYQLLPFEHSNVDGTDVGIRAFPSPVGLGTQINLLRPTIQEPSGDFKILTDLLWKFANDGNRLGRIVITYCKQCKRLCILKMGAEPVCPYSNHSLLI
jgi:hypothetical protein